MAIQRAVYDFALEFRVANVLRLDPQASERLASILVAIVWLQN